MSAAVAAILWKKRAENSPRIRSRGVLAAKRVKLPATRTRAPIKSSDPEKNHVRFEILDAVMRADLGSPLKGTLLALAYHENKEGQWVWPKLETLAGESGLNRKTVVRSLSELIAMGLIDRQSRSGTSSQYRLNTQPILGLAHFRADPNTGHGVAQIRADTQPKYGPLTSPGDPSKNGSTPPASPSPFRGEASRLLEKITKDCKPAFDDLQFLKAAAEGDELAWRRFQRSTEGATKRFRKATA